MATILFVDDDEKTRQILQDSLERMGHTPLGASRVLEGLAHLAHASVDLIITDYQLPGVSGLEFLEMLKQEGLQIPVIMLTGHGSIEHAVTSIRAGVVDYITKPIRVQQLEIAVNQALELIRLRRENQALAGAMRDVLKDREIIGESAQIRKLMTEIARVAPTNAHVLIRGESGTGKELVARALHHHSRVASGPFIKRNCAAIPEQLVESELFGHERGAFTHAEKMKLGAFELADGGTLLLDEISEMKVELQAKLLRAIQEQEFTRVGGTKTLKVNVRIVSTSNRDLLEEIEAGRFRRDLYYRLDVISIELPPLRERPGDIPVLATHFGTRVAEANGLAFDGFTSAAMAALQAQEWPGNIRQLQNTIEKALIGNQVPLLDVHHLRLSPRPSLLTSTPHVALAAIPPAVPKDGIVLDSLNVAEAERRLIEEALVRAGGVKTRAAEILGIPLRTLRNKLNVGGSTGPRRRRQQTPNIAGGPALSAFEDRGEGGVPARGQVPVARA
ncbi:MAG: sigma-54-dependent transcriptional regulator [Gemmatimonadaceae bacterium]